MDLQGWLDVQFVVGCWEWMVPFGAPSTAKLYIVFLFHSLYLLVVSQVSL